MARVLVVEDEFTIAMVLYELLTEAGHEVDAVCDGCQALERLRRGPLPEVVLMDLFVPGASGRQLVEAMRSDERLQGIPVLLVTGAAPCEEDFPARHTYQGVISKPFDVFDVLDRVESLLGE